VGEVRSRSEFDPDPDSDGSSCVLVVVAGARLSSGLQPLGTRRVDGVAQKTSAELCNDARRWRLVLVLLVSLAGLLSLGCDRQPGDVLAFGLAQAPRNLDPRLATDATSERINRLLYERLVEFDDASRPVPGIAHWQQITPTRYRFVLRDGRRSFVDGSRPTARDVASTYRSIIAADSASPHRALLSIIRELRVVDAERLDFLLREPDPQFPTYLGIGILPARLIEAGHDFQREPVGSGAFRLLRWPSAGRLEILRRRDGQQFAFLAVKDPNVRAMKLLRGEVQMLQNDLPPELVDFLAGREGIRIETVPGSNFSYLGLNLDDPGTGDRRVRRAIAHAIDREAILRHLFQGRGRLAEALLPPEHWAGTAALQPHAHDPQRARALLQAAGYGPERPLRLQLKTSSDPFRLRLAAVLQAQLRRAGIDTDVRSYDWGTFFGDIKAGRFQLYGLTWVGIRTPDIFRYAFHSDALPPDGANRGRYRNAAADRLIDAARGEPQPKARAALYRALQAILHADLPYVPLWYEDQVFTARADIVGYRLASDGKYDGLKGVRRAAAVNGQRQRGSASSPLDRRPP